MSAHFSLIPVAALALLLGACAGNPVNSTSDSAASSETATGTLVMHKGAFCGCCDAWARHLRDNGFSTDSESYTHGLDEFKDQWRVPEGLRGCHTGIWEGKYVFEGHVPARYIRQYLSNPPPGSIGLAVPGMPAGSPGMYAGGDFQPYNIYLLMENGDYRFFTQVTDAG